MRAVIARTLIAAALSVSVAHAACTRLEFAELESISTPQLLKMRCQYYDEMTRWVNLTPAGAKPTAAEARVVLHNANACATEIQRMDRIIVRKESIQGDDAQVATAITQRCSGLTK